MDFSQFPFREVSSIAIWIPIFLAAIKLKTGDLKFRLFFLFLLFGAGVDGLGWFTFWTSGDSLLHSIFQFLYLLYEALFFVWLCTGFLKWNNALLIRKIFNSLVMILFLIRAWILFFNEIDPYNSAIIISVVDSAFLIIASFLSAFALLHMAEEREDLLSFSWFWILSGIFFYSFGTFFIDIFSYVDFVGEIWRIRNVVNVIQYGFFVVGIVKMNNAQ